jgi:hypothetical protein
MSRICGIINATTKKATTKQQPRKFPNVVDSAYHLLRALSYFDDAERADMPKMLKRIA